MTKHGKYIVVEGTDGTGKTTQAHMLVSALQGQGYDAHYVHEPGGTALGFELEKLIKNRHIKRSPLTDLLLFTANRVELYQQIIAPALQAGKIIVADRSWLSSFAYQGVAEGLGAERVRHITEEYLPSAYLYPHFTALLYVPEAQRIDMLSHRATSEDDHFETRSSAYQARVGEGYQEAAHFLLAFYQEQRHAIDARVSRISAEGTVDEVLARIINELTHNHIT